MIRNFWLLMAAAAFAAGCATQEAPKPAPAPAPAPAPVAKPATPTPTESEQEIRARAAREAAERAAKAKAAAKPVAQKVTFAADVLFDFDKAVVKPDGKAKLDDLSAKIKDLNLEVVIAIGHADRIGSDAYNQKLSVRRAESVKAYVVSKGIEPNRVYTEGKGEKQPVSGDKCRKMGREHRSNKKLVECLSSDRRVEIEVIGTRRQ